MVYYNLFYCFLGKIVLLLNCIFNYESWKIICCQKKKRSTNKTWTFQTNKIPAVKNKSIKKKTFPIKKRGKFKEMRTLSCSSSLLFISCCSLHHMILVPLSLSLSSVTQLRKRISSSDPITALSVKTNDPVSKGTLMKQ